MSISEKQLRDAGFSGVESIRDEVALRLLCAFNGVDRNSAPPGWWAHPNSSSQEAWKRVADEARRIFASAETSDMDASQEHEPRQENDDAVR